MKILLEGPILTKSGYGEHARLVYRSLLTKPGLDIYINPLNWGTCSWDIPDQDLNMCIAKFKTYEARCNQSGQNQQYNIQIHVGIPNEFTKKAPYSVCVTAGIETDRVSAPWQMKTHQGIDKMIVPSKHAERGFVETVYEVLNRGNQTKTALTCACPIDVIHYPVKSPSGPGLEVDFKTSFNFLQIAMIGHRKNIQQSIKCFIEAFREEPDVGLVLKTSMSKSSVIDRQRTKKDLETFISSFGEKKCKIYLIHGNLSESQIHSLYTHPKIKAYYTTTHGEGYGLPIFEAAYSGLPVIATNWSGHLDFLSGNLKGKEKALFAKIDYDLKPVQDRAVWGDLIIKESKWAFPKDVSIKKQLTNMYKNYGMYKKWAGTLKEKIIIDHAEEKILQEMIDSILRGATTEEFDTYMETNSREDMIKNWGMKVGK